MKKVKITVMRKVRHDDLIEKYENPLEHECDVDEGQVFMHADAGSCYCRETVSCLFPLLSG